MAKRALCRQTPKVGAECPNWACSELSGGRSEMSVPTGNQPWGPPCPAARAGAGGGTPRHPGALMPLRAGRGRQIRPACYPSVRGRRPIYVKLHGSVLHAIFGVELLTATAPVWLRLSGFVACIARKVIPRVRPPVCCVQYTAPSRHIACNVHCTPSLHAINRPVIPESHQNRPIQAPRPPKWPLEAFLNVRFRTDGPSAPSCPDKSLSIDAALPSLNSEPRCIKVVDTFRAGYGPSSGGHLRMNIAAAIGLKNAIEGGFFWLNLHPPNQRTDRRLAHLIHRGEARDNIPYM